MATELLWSWLSLALIPLAGFYGFATAHLPYVWFDRVEGESAPWWFDILVSTIALGVLWVPIGASMVFGRRALKAGSTAAWVPLGIGVMLTAAVLVLVLASAVG